MLFTDMFDRDGNGTISVNEFQELWNYINQWKGTFDRIDTNRSGSIESQELSNGKFRDSTSVAIRPKATKYPTKYKCTF